VYIGTGNNDAISAENRVVITSLLIKAAPSSSNKPQPAAAAAEEGDGSQEPATKKPRVEATADSSNGTAAAAAGSGGGSGGRGMASVHSSAGVQSAVVCYVCQLATIPGKFDPQKAAQLGVPRGPVSKSLCTAPVAALAFVQESCAFCTSAAAMPTLEVAALAYVQ
jgi:hypothetical protein